ncbi:uncharacterized protein LOC128871887 [Anastrepha ludens]|uniref:uncharacterized protein LOC128871887 n=1 Tax=Anastrepha ludens TaxID=28586 RepID=UPI0023B0A870|nr:uncharacterized protein LOC128871887 [Anastrepha ludens]
MSRVNSPSSNNSGTSSETSETQSAEENKISGIRLSENFDLQNRVSKSWKRMKDLGGNQGGEKDEEAKRPPWRAVSVSTLPKPDKNALLRAKLLDASRRLRAGRTSIGLQTNLEPTKLLRDVNLGAQTDLVFLKHKGVLTDGFYTKKTDDGHEFILTYSVSQSTDPVKVSNAATQTLLPKCPGDVFLNSYLANDGTAKHISHFSDEKELLRQICGTRNLELFTESDSKCSFSSPNSTEKSRKICTKSNLLQPTLLSWNFNYGDVGDGTNKSKFVPYTIQANRPWRSFAPLTLTSVNQGSSIGYVPYNWKALLPSIDELIYETNRLLDIIEDNLSTRQHYYKRLLSKIEILEFKQQKLIIPSEKWLPLIETEEKKLVEMSKNLMISN